MAQTTSKSRQKSGSSSKRGSSSKSGSSSTNGASARPRTASSSRRTASSRASSGKSSGGSRSSSAKRSNANRGSNGLKGQVKNARKAASSGVQTAGHAVGTAATKAKGPALAGGAALAGLVGGMTIARGGRRRVLGVPVPGTRRPLIKVKRPMRANTTRDLVKAAGRMGNAGRQMAELASEVRLAREQMGADGRRRSPVEVVLDGLTARRPR